MSDDDNSQGENDAGSLFEKALKGTRPLKSSRIDPRGKPPAPKPRFSATETTAPVTRGVVIYEQTPGHGAEDRLEYSIPGPQKKLLKKLRKGLVPSEATLDLHRKTLRDGAELVHEFLQAAVQSGCRCVLVIHGKGLGSGTDEPKMKNQVAMWLKNHEAVLAFCSALPEDGGAGALYVLLRRG